MKTLHLLAVAVLALAFSACKSDVPANTNAAAKPSETKSASAGPAVDPSAPATFPYQDFPAVETIAKAGEVVLAPSYNWLQEANVKKPGDVTMIWYAQKMSAPGKETSEVEFLMGKKHQVPNAYIVPIPAGGKAKKGDIVLTWWQSGSGMQRAIVVDDANPSEPVVRYLDIAYDNPAKGKDGKTPLAESEEKLKPNSFSLINAPLQPGAAVAIQDGADYKHAIVIRVAGDKVFVNGFAGKTDVVARARCTGVPVVSAAKAGEKVKAKWVGKFREGTVTKVDFRNGRVFVKFDNDPDEEGVAFGDVMK